MSLFLLVALAAVCATAHITDLTADTLDSTIFDSKGNVKGNWFVEFYSPRCGHCQRLAPEFSRLADSVSSSNLHFAKVDCTAEANRHLCYYDYDVKHYPQLKLFRAGNSKSQAVQTYDDGRNVYAMSHYLHQYGLIDNNAYNRLQGGAHSFAQKMEKVSNSVQ